MSDDHSNWISQRDLEMVSARGYLLFMDLRKLPESQIAQGHTIAGGVTKIDPAAIRSLIDSNKIELLPPGDPAWNIVSGGYDGFMQKLNAK